MDYMDFVKSAGQTSAPEVSLDPSMLRALQQTALSIARDIRDYCAAEGIEFTLAAGSVLGAIRHGGIIPWDDDIDINMTRTEWERFYPGFAARFADKYDVLSRDTEPNWELAQAKVCLKGTVVREALTPPADATGVFVDLFLIESTSNVGILRSIQGLGSQAVRLISSATRLRSRRAYLEAVLAGNEEALRWFRRRFRIGLPFSFLSPARWVDIANWWHGLWRNQRSEYVTSPANVLHYFGELVRRDVIYPPAVHEFENELWPVPARAHDYLTWRYGRWRELPELEKRGGHVFAEFDLGSFGKPSQVKAPQVKAPQVKAPQVKAPQVKAPQVKAPQVKAGDRPLA